MKRFLLFFVAALLFVACDNKFEDVGNTIQRVSTLPTLTAEFADEDTRTYVEDNTYLRWHEGDLISAFVGNSRNSKYIFDGKTGDNSGEFKPVSSNSSGEVYDLNRNCALYPYDEDATVDSGGSISCSLPAVQEYAENSFGKGANTMVAVTKDVDDTFLAFKNACGYLKVKLYGEATVKSIELKGNNGEKIAGKATISAEYGAVPKVVMSDDTTDSITLDCGEGITLSSDAENPTEFWVVVPPMEFSEGLTIVATDTNGVTFEKSTNKKVTITRNEIKPMAALEAIFSNPTKPAYNEIWYTSSDGEIIEIDALTEWEKFGTFSTSNTYEDGKGVITFYGDITKIGNYAFSYCSSLTSITIPDSVTEIGNYAFRFCDSLTSVTIGDSVTSIGNYAFDNCSSLKSVTIPDSVTSIGNNAFYNCSSLTSVTIPDSVTTIGDGTFHSCSSLTSITIPDSVTEIGKQAFYYCSSLTSVTIPDSVTSIEDGTFGNCSNLTSVTIPNSVTTIGGSAFSSCDSLTNVTIPDSVTTIGSGAFSRCSSLTSITIPDSVITIGSSAFCNCTSLTSVYCKATTPPSLGNFAFDYSNNGPYKPIGCSIYVPQGSLLTYRSATEWSDYAQYIVGYDFEGGEVMLNNKIYYTSSDGKIVEPYIGTVNDITTNEIQSFGVNIISNTYENGKGVITFDGDVLKIGISAFYKCYNLSSITIPYGVTKIGYGAFEGCTNLTKVINESTALNNIEQEPFKDCPNLKTFEGELVSEDGRCLVSENGVLLTCITKGLTEYTLPNNVKEVYKSAFQYQNDIKKLTIPEGVTTIGWHAFAHSNSLTEVTIPKSVTDLVFGAFEGCENLSKLHIHNNIIGKAEFSHCTSLTDIIIPDNVTTIGNLAFSGCERLRSVTFHNNLKAIGEKAFDYCALTSVTIPESVETIGDAPFSRCNKLMEFNGKFASGDKICLIADGRLIDVANGIVKELSDYTIPAEVTHIGDNVFNNYSNLNSITIPEGVVDIGYWAFGYCTNLREITIPSTVTDIGSGAFSLCSKMSAIYFRGATPPNVYEGGNYTGRHIATQGTVIRVPDEYIDNYKNSTLWGDGYYTLLSYSDELYSSTDYSEDGKVTLLNRATKGNGIDIVIMGDAYSDRQIAAGDYSSDINKAIEALFSEEPYKSFRDYFNVYMVTVVSPYDGYFIGSTALGGYFGSGTLVGGNHSSVINYAQKAISDERMDDAMLVVIMNREYYAGTCYMYYSGGTSDCGKGLSISYFPLGTDDSMFAQLILHETGGHGFAKLADEYSYQNMGRISESDVQSYKKQTQNWGWWKNVDFTSDTSAVRWSHFINDNRYANEGLGAFEGGLTYWSGVWRPTKNSIMNQNIGGFNAPSREAIYYRIHKLAYGDSWEYDYEKFVEWDKSKGAAASKASSWHAPLKYPHTTPPVVVGHSWRDAK